MRFTDRFASALGHVRDAAPFYTQTNPAVAAGNLNRDALLFVLSSTLTANCYHVIDISTDREGFVHKDFVSIDSFLPCESATSSHIGRSKSHQPTFEVLNRTRYRLTLKMNDIYFYLEPYECRELLLQPGWYHCRASAPGVTPYVTLENVRANQAYAWDFYMGSETQ